MTTAFIYAAGGLALLLAVALPHLLKRMALSAPIVLVAAGWLMGLVPGPGGMDLSRMRYGNIVLHFSEITVLVALMGVGLALDRALSLKSWRTWKAWSNTWRLLLIAMPVSILVLTLFGHFVLGFSVAAALLIAAALAPTDPVLAADVQVDGPTVDADGEVDEHDEVRFALTSEAGFNDALAFPFVALALLMATATLGPVDWALWFGWDLVGRTVLGAAIGVGVGWVLANVAFRETSPEAIRLAERGEPLLAVAGLMVAYGLAELVHGWGFLAVFACALTIRAKERQSYYHALMHQMIERLELLLTLGMLLLLGVSLQDGLLETLTWRGALMGLALVFVVRPVVAWLALGKQSHADYHGDGRLGPRERLVTAFFGVRGVGSMFYIAFALGHGNFGDEDELWAAMAFTIALSVLVHGVTATPAMRWLGAVRVHREPVTH